MNALNELDCDKGSPSKAGLDHWPEIRAYCIKADLYCSIQHYLKRGLMRPPKTAILQIRLTEDEKRLAELAAEQDDRSLTNYVLRLIKADVARRGIRLPQK